MSGRLPWFGGAVREFFRRADLLFGNQPSPMAKAAMLMSTSKCLQNRAQPGDSPGIVKLDLAYRLKMRELSQKVSDSHGFHREHDLERGTHDG